MPNVTLNKAAAKIAIQLRIVAPYSLTVHNALRGDCQVRVSPKETVPALKTQLNRVVHHPRQLFGTHCTIIFQLDKLLNSNMIIAGNSPFQTRDNDIEWAGFPEINKRIPDNMFRDLWEDNLTTSRNLLPGISSAVLAVALLTATPAGAQEVVKYKVVDGSSIPASLTGKPGNAEKGRAAAIHRRKGNCLACHVMPVPEQQFHGEVGPSLEGVGSRYSEGELRLRIVDPKVFNPDTIMPAFYKADGLHRVAKKHQGKTMLTAEEVEDIVAYLKTLKE